MKKVQKAAIVYLIIFVQSALAITAGVFAVYYFSGSKLSEGTKVGKVDLENMEKAVAVDVITQNYIDLFMNGKLQISVKDGDTYSIPFSDFEISIDAEKTINSITENDTSTVFSVLNKIFKTGSTVAGPVINFNESKLRKILIGLAKKIDSEPVNAALYYDNGKIVKKPEQDGQKLNITNAVESIRKHISKDPSEVLLLNRYDNYAIETLQPELKLRDLDEVDSIISEYSTKLIYPEFADAIKHAADALDGHIIYPSGGQNNKTDSFSFVEWLKISDGSFENDNEGYDQVASTLYAALLSAGIDKKVITRLAHEVPVDYIEPGLDAWISGNGGELRFSNSLTHKIVLLADMESERLVVRIAGNSSDKKQEVSLKVDIVDHFPPPVLFVESENLKKGEKIVLESGTEGIKVNVYRGNELISEDKYEAIKKVVQIGPDTDWSNNEEGK